MRPACASVGQQSCTCALYPACGPPCALWGCRIEGCGGAAAVAAPRPSHAPALVAAQSGALPGYSFTAALAEICWAAPLPAACSRLSCCGVGASVRRAFKARRWLWCSSRPNTDRSAAAPQEHQLCYRSGWAAAAPWQPGAGFEPNGARAREPAQRRDWHGAPAPAAPQAVGWGGQCIEGSEQCHPVAAGFGRGSPGGFPRRAAPPRPRQAALCCRGVPAQRRRRLQLLSERSCCAL